MNEQVRGSRPIVFLRFSYLFTSLFTSLFTFSIEFSFESFSYLRGSYDTRWGFDRSVLPKS